ncbi:hypothetical protein DICVIV_00899 [Dictyocaulus viviparus]|uniref:Secreted protein n=1 Tax=Dictyocaulus viviparus TaxID=29172 RepID=A0A0D8YA46_DICVI|nr:hypothetical protein DICVIV_00899 [Dictyocaulus viviparus]
MWWSLPATLLLMTFHSMYVVVSEIHAHRHKSQCFSCASFAYLPLWSQLMHHYFPPKNFTDRCWQPDAAIGRVPCSSVCFTLVERIDQHDCKCLQKLF